MLSSNETNVDLEAKYVNWVGMMFIRCYCFLMIPLSIIGHSLSIFVFTRRSLRTNPCIMYFRAATVFGLLTSCFILPMRLIQSGFIGIDPTVHSIYICKIVWFLLYSIRYVCICSLIFKIILSNKYYLSKCMILFRSLSYWLIT